MGLRFDPVGGGQFKAAVQAMIDAEKVPIKSLEAKKAKEDARYKLFQDFKTRFGELQRATDEISSFRKLRELKVDLGDGADVIGVTVDKEKAQPGVYQVTVDELAGRKAIITNGFEDPDAPVLGMGYFKAYGANDNDIEVFVDESTASLRGLAKAINTERNSPVSAEVVRDEYDPDRPWRLIVKSKTDGLTDSAEIPEFYFLGGKKDIYIDDDRSAKNAILRIDDFEIEAKSNTIENFFEGVNLRLLSARPDTPVTMKITVDYDKVSGKLKGTIDGVNKVLEFITKQNTIDQSTDTSTTFAGDTSLQSVEYRMRNLMHEGFASNDPDHPSFRIVHLNEIGLEFGKNGQILFNQDKFKKALESDFDGIAEAISGEFGFANQLRSVVGMYTRPGDGLIAMREQGLKNRIRRIDDDIARKNILLDKKTESLVSQFSRLQASLGNLQQQQQYMQATLGGGGGNLVSQLLG